MRTSRIAALVAVSLTCAVVFGEELRVPERFASIQAAVAASVTGDVVLVAPGTYREALDLLGKKITIRGSGGAAVTILDGGSLDTTIINATKGESRSTIVEGFTFRNGRGKPTQSCSMNGRLGGAMFVLSSGISVIDCVFEHNGVSDVPGGSDIRAGGAIFACQSDITVTGTRFDANGAVTGGAIDFRTSNRRATIERSGFTANRASTGGAMHVYMEQTGRTTIDRSSFTSNETAHGGGISVDLFDAAIMVVSASDFDANRASHGGGIEATTWQRSRLRITDTDFTGGTAAFGGGINANAGGSSTTELFRCSFSGNEAGFGGGLFGAAAGGSANETAGTLTLSECRFLDNVAHEVPDVGLAIDDCFTDGLQQRGDGFLYGGGAAVRTIFGGSVMLTNCLFAGNSAPRGAGASASSCGGGAINFVNTTIADNDGHGLYARLGVPKTSTEATSTSFRVANSIIWNNSAQLTIDRANPAAITSVTFSDIEGGFAGASNLAVAPQFVNPGARDYRLSGGSACIDAGDSTVLDATVAADLAGRLRRLDDPYTRDTGIGKPIVDLGAYEFQPSVPRRRATGSR